VEHGGIIWTEFLSLPTGTTGGLLCVISITITIIIIIPQSVLRQAHSLLQSKFSTECHLVLPTSEPSPLYWIQL